MFKTYFEPFFARNFPKLKNNQIFQKLSQAVLISATSAAVPFHGNVRRNLQGSWIDSLDRTLNTDRTRRAEIDGELGFQTLATMMLYMNGFGADLNNPELHNQYTNKVAELKEKYTNYGCYCWIDGADAGVIGGGKTKGGFQIELQIICRNFQTLIKLTSS